jgi:hypothetical protein
MRRTRRFTVASASAVGALTVTAQAALGHGSALHVGLAPGSTALEIDLPFASLLAVATGGAALAIRHEIRRRGSRPQRSNRTSGRPRRPADPGKPGEPIGRCLGEVHADAG